MSQRALVESGLAQVMAQRSMNQMRAIRLVTQTALTQVNQVHRHAVREANKSLTEAERTQRLAGKPLTEPTFVNLTVDYLDELTRITEQIERTNESIEDTKLVNQHADNQLSIHNENNRGAGPTRGIAALTAPIMASPKTPAPSAYHGIRCHADS